MKKKKIALFILVTIGVIYSIKLALIPHPEGPNLSQIKIAIPKLYSSALIIIANEQGMFKNNKLDVSLDNLNYGKDCLEEMLLNKYDFSVAYVTPVATQIHNGKKFSILTELHSSSDNTAILYRKDLISDIENNLSSKRVGLVKGTHSEFLLYLFSRANSIKHEKLMLVDGDIPDLEKMLLTGEVGSAVLWQPTVYKLLNKYPEILAKADVSFYKEFSVLIGNNDFIKSNPQSVYALIKSLVQAKAFIDSSPAEAHEIILNYLKKDTNHAPRETYSKTQIDLGLSKMFAVMLSSELNWKNRATLKFLEKSEEVEHYKLEFLKKYAPEKITY